MKFFFGATGEHKIYVRVLAKCLDRLKYDFELYDFGDLEAGKKFEISFEKGIGSCVMSPGGEKIQYFPKIALKPLVVLDAMYNNEQEELLVYLDADTYLNDRIDEISTDDYDVGITVHPPEYIGKGWPGERFPEKTGYLNAGVIFFRNNHKAMKFVRDWMASCIFNSDNHSDQEGLTALVKHLPLKYYEVYDVDGVRVKCFPAEVYNNCIKHQEHDGIKIRHAAGFQLPINPEKNAITYLRQDDT